MNSTGVERKSEVIAVAVDAEDAAHLRELRESFHKEARKFGRRRMVAIASMQHEFDLGCGDLALEIEALRKEGQTTGPIGELELTREQRFLLDEARFEANKEPSLLQKIGKKLVDITKRQ